MANATKINAIALDLDRLERVLRVHLSDRLASNDAWLDETAATIAKLLGEANTIDDKGQFYVEYPYEPQCCGADDYQDGSYVCGKHQEWRAYGPYETRDEADKVALTVDDSDVVTAAEHSYTLFHA